ncbi:MAG: transcriptional repressor [Betaproteobacteria bacterium]|nr:transcriptional repressor [Betaproteobacteria bacterium]
MERRAYSREEVVELLRWCDINVTHQRVEIAHALFSRMEHLSADQILSLVNGQHAESSKATVYNTLKLFREKGLVREVIVDPSRVFYDPNTAPHHHFYDVVSGRLTDIPADQIHLSGVPTLPRGVVPEGVDIIIRTRPAG